MESNYFNVDYVLQFIDSPIIISIQNFLCTNCVGDHMVDIIPELLVNDELTYVRIMSFRQGVKKGILNICYCCVFQLRQSFEIWGTFQGITYKGAITHKR